MINKDINSIEYSDIEKLQQDKVPESDTLDYKKEMMNDDAKLLKHICAFANTRGGDIIFGIKESGDGGHPEEIIGLTGDINKERIEQIVLSNIVPRLPITIHLVKVQPDKQKTIMIIRIPNSSLKPHFDSKNQKYYKRFQLQSCPMTEQDVCDYYKQRFSNHDTLKQYISDNTPRKALISDGVNLNIIIIPSNIEHRLIDTSDYTKLEWITRINSKYSTPCCPRNFPRLNFFGKGIKCDAGFDYMPTIEIHRNGCIVYKQYFKHRTPMIFDEKDTVVGLLQALEFGSEILSHYGYFGEVRLSACIESNSMIRFPKSFDSVDGPDEYKVHIDVNREHPLQYVMDNRESVAESIMNEIVNNFNVDRCKFF